MSRKKIAKTIEAGLLEYKKGDSFSGVIARTASESTPAWQEPVRSKKDAPNILFIVLDDTGFGHLGSYGSPIKTPNLDKLAKNGLLYNNMHTTALCTPTRSCIITGRNHHSNHVGLIMEASTGFPGYDGNMPFENGFLPEMLLEKGYNTYAIGKWHMTPAEQMSAAGPYDRWPTGRGFERFFGFLGGDTHQYYPNLVSDQMQVEPNKTPEEGYTLNEDLADKAISFIKDAKQVAQDKPFFMYYSTGAMHAPHHVPKEWADKYKGQFDSGWQAYRDETFARQKQMGIIPKDTVVSKRDPDVQDWDKLSDDERKVYARMMEVFAGFLEQTDYHIGRVIKAIRDLDELDNTIVMVISDNGSSPEGGATGSVNENKFFNLIPESIEENLAAIDKIGGPEYFNHFPWGWTWAGNTPFRRWKRETYRGGISDPFIVSWPKGIKSKGEIRTGFVHAIDMVPTILDMIDMAPPQDIKGVSQSPMEGVSFAHTFDDAKAESKHETQYFEMLGTRSIYHKGWRAVCPFPGPSFTEGKKKGYEFGQEITPEDMDKLDKEGWELYNVEKDPAETKNISKEHSDKLRELIELWYVEAGKYNVLPVSTAVQMRFASQRPQLSGVRDRYVYYPGTQDINADAGVNILNRSHVIAAVTKIPEDGAEGVLLAAGGVPGGYTLYVKDKKLHYIYNYATSKYHHIVSSEEVPTGKVLLSFQFEVTGKPDIKSGLGAPGIGKLFINDKEVGSLEMKELLPLSLGLTEGISCGRDSGSAVTSEYTAPFTFTGELEKVIIDVTGDTIPMHKEQIRKAMARQ